MMGNVMNSKWILGVIVALSLWTAAGSVWARQQARPFSKSEIISLIKQSESGPHDVSQGDIAVEVQRRGVDFAIDDKVLDEFRRAGARSFLLNAIKHAQEEANRPRMEPQDLDSNEPESPEARRRAEVAALAKLPLIEQARYYALDFGNELPNFVVNQVVTRYLEHSASRNWQLQDKLEIELTYQTDKGEQFKVVTIDGKPTTTTYDSLGGSTSTGEFGSILMALFLPRSNAEFKEVKHDNLNGRDTVVYEFRVKRTDSTSRITDKNSGKSVIAGYSGSIWIDTETKRVLRIEESNDEIPAGFPITLSENAVDYDWVTIAGERFLLPVHAELLLGRDADRIYTKNTIEFRKYHKFEGDVKIIPNDK
jgi:hypothetical protein